jgi:DNA-binding transcriptional LysR family regulator
VARAARGPRRLVVGFRAGVIPTPAIAALCELHLDLVVDVKRLEWDDQEHNLLSGDVDIAYVRQPITERGLCLIPLYHERRLVALRRDHHRAKAEELWQSDIEDERHLRYLQPLRPGGTPIRSVEEKLEHVAAGHGIIVLPLSATQYYGRPDVVYVPVLDAELDQVYLASEATRRSKLITAFIQVVQQALPSSKTASAQAETAAPV